jgi:Ca2+-binding EF-hand superfamily protein
MLKILNLAVVVCVVSAGLTFTRAEDPPARPEAQRPEVARLLERNDRNKDGVLDKDECPEPLRRRFEALDRNQDGKLSREELQQAATRLGRPDPAPAARGLDPLFRLLDADNDGKLSREELQNASRLLDRLDKNKNGSLEADEVRISGQPGGRPGEIITPAAKGERHTDKLKVGDDAPDFVLPDLAGKTTVRLSSFKTKQPVVLVFASYT